MSPMCGQITMISLLSTSMAMALLRSHIDGPKFFSLCQTSKIRDAFKTPLGTPFWSFGVCCVERGTPKDKYDPKNISYGSWKLFPSDEAWAKDTVLKLRSWGFNTLGGWSDDSVISKLPKSDRMPYTVVLHLGAYYRAPWDDLFSTEAHKAIDSAAKKQIEPIRSDPNLIGYFTDNELGWWDDTVFLNYVVKLPSGSKGRKAAHSLLRKLYGSFEEFQKDWLTTNKSWDDFDANPNLHLRPGYSGSKAINAWMSTIGDYYYQTVHDAVRRYDKRHLILGDRYQQYYNIPLAKASSKWIDVCSTNSGADWNDGTYSYFFLDTLHKITKKPIVISEFYMCATENRSGNKNSSAAFPLVKTQTERAKAFSQNLKSLAALPYVIGAHWFQFTDEPEHGRGDGENFNMGLIDTKGQPYKEITDAAKSLHTSTFPTRPLSDFHSDRIPSVSFEPLSSNSLKAWPRSQSLILPTMGDAFADLYAVQTRDAIYLGLYAVDYIDQSLYEGEIIPEPERAHWKVRIGGKDIDVRFGGSTGKNKPIPCKVTGHGVTIIERPDLRHTVILRIPKTSLVKTSKLKIQSYLSSHSRSETMQWNRSINF